MSIKISALARQASFVATDDDLEKVCNSTWAGQASWATDSERTCKACFHLENERTGHRCGKFRSLMGKAGPRIPASAHA